jgi:hypothetical protein
VSSEKEKEMAQISVDLSEAIDLTVVPGVYPARITGAEVKAAKNGGNYIKWEMTIFGATGELERFNNHKVWHNTMTSGKGAGMLKTLVKAATQAELSGSLDTDALLGKEVNLTLVEGKDQNGQPSGYPEVKAVKPYAPF